MIKKTQHSEICELYKAGASQIELANKYGCTHQRIQQILKKHDISYKKDIVFPKIEKIKAEVEKISHEVKIDEIKNIKKKYNLKDPAPLKEKYGINLNLHEYKRNLHGLMHELYVSGLSAQEICNSLSLNIDIQRFYQIIFRHTKTRNIKMQLFEKHKTAVFKQIVELKEQNKTMPEIASILQSQGVTNISNNRVINQRNLEYIYKTHKNT